MSESDKAKTKEDRNMTDDFTEFLQGWLAGYNKAKTGTPNSQEAVRTGAAESWRKYQEWKHRQGRSEREGTDSQRSYARSWSR